MPTTAICAGSSRRIRPCSHVGNMTVPPAVKFVRTKSSSEMAKTNNAPDTIASLAGLPGQYPRSHRQRSAPALDLVRAILVALGSQNSLTAEFSLRGLVRLSRKRDPSASYGVFIRKKHRLEL